MFGKRLNEALQNRNITQVELSKELGFTSQAINRWCQNLTQPDIPTLIKIAEYLNVSIDFLVGNEAKNDSAIEEEIKEKEILKNTLIKNGYMNENEDLNDDELEKLIEFVKTNKKYIKECK